MPNLNKVQLMGRLTRDPELRSTTRGTSVVNMSVAINREWKDDAGEKKEEVTFVDVDAFGKIAEIMGKHLTKGRSVYIDGRLRAQEWTDKQGQKRTKLGVVAEAFQFLGDGQRQTEPRNEAPTRKPAPAPGQDTDDVPF